MPKIKKGGKVITIKKTPKKSSKKKKVNLNRLRKANGNMLAKRRTIKS